MTVLDSAGKRALLAELLRQKAQRSQPIPLSAAQHRLWLLAQLESDGSTYNVPFAFRLRGPLDITALRRALDAVARRHDVLRATVHAANDEPLYSVRDLTLELATVDLAPPDSVDAILARASAQPFDLAIDIPIRALLVRIAAHEHVLLVTLHHIATDGWSMGIFKRELGVLYDAYYEHRPSPLAQLAFTYGDYVQWQRERLYSDDFKRQRQYWDEQLADVPAPLDLGVGRTNAAFSGAAGDVRTRTVSAQTYTALHALCRAHGATEFSTLFAAFAVLLYRYTGQRDFIVGSAFADRRYAQVEGLMGFFVNTLPLRARIVGDPLFTGWLTQVHDLTLDAIENQDVPIQTLVAQMRPQRVALRQPLVNVMFVLQNTPDEALAFSQVEVTPLELARTTAKFDLTLEVRAGRDLQFAIEYRRDLFDSETIDALLSAYTTLVDEIVRNPRRPLSGFPLLPLAEQQRQVAAANDTARPLTGRRIERLFEQQAALGPNAVAIVDRSRQLTYGTLNERANRVAGYLRSLTPRAARIGLYFEPGADAIVAMLAILKAGGIYVPLDPHSPPQRLAHMVADAGVSIVLSNIRSAAAGLAEGEITLVRLDRDLSRYDRFAAHDSAVPDDELSADPASIMYTSGSTGSPKGVVVAHAGIERLVVGSDYIRVAPGDAVAHASTLAFDASTFEIWAPLLNGARIVVIPTHDLLVPNELKRTLERRSVTIMFLTTALMREIVRTAPQTLATLRHLLVGGDVFDTESAARLSATAPHVHIHNLYGPTEATTFATHYSLDTLPPTATLPIGKPIANTRVYVLDANHQPVPGGAFGELYIGGPGVALGYLNDDELTAKKFIADPFDSAPNARLYATGDRVRRLASGDLEFVGRLDGQIKLRGFRIEPAEIEAALRDCPEIVDAVVIAAGDAAQERRLIAYVIPVRATTFHPKEVRQLLRLRLPAFMIPAAIIALPRFPLKRNGKIDRDALLDFLPHSKAATSTAPTTEVHTALTGLWQRLLAVEPIGIDDNFFDLGGHSLLAVRLIGEIERIFGTRLPLSVLFEQPTIDALAHAIRDNVVNSKTSPLTVFNRTGTAQPLFFLHGSINGGGFYCRKLADELGTDRPLYVLAPHSNSAGSLPPIEAMAADYLTVVKSAQPHGPYLLGGFCAGGLIAFEIAQRLRAAGELVTNVILLDVPDAPASLRHTAPAIERVATYLRLSRERRRQLTGALARLPHHFRRFVRSRSKVDHVRQRLNPLAARGSRPPGKRVAEADGFDSLARPWVPIVEAYVPRAYSGRLTLLQAVDGATGERAQRSGWSTIGPRVELRTLRGSHETCISDFVADTARAIAGVLEDRS